LRHGAGNASAQLLTSEILSLERESSMTYQLLIIVSLDKKRGDSGTALSSHVVGFETMGMADQAYRTVTQHDKTESYAQVQAVKLYGGLP
jgi:hypothetical protein